LKDYEDLMPKNPEKLNENDNSLSTLYHNTLGLVDWTFGFKVNTLGNEEENDNAAMELHSDIVFTMLGGVAGCLATIVFPIGGILICLYVFFPDSVLNDFSDKVDELTGGVTKQFKKMAGEAIDDPKMKDGEHMETMTQKLKKEISNAANKAKEFRANKTNVSELISKRTSVVNLGNSIMDKRSKVWSGGIPNSEEIKKFENLKTYLKGCLAGGSIKVEDFEKRVKTIFDKDDEEGLEFLTKYTSFLKQNNDSKVQIPKKIAMLVEACDFVVTKPKNITGLEKRETDEEKINMIKKKETLNISL
jgi:ribosomal protein S21